MFINVENGSIEWHFAVAREQVYGITVRASNMIGWQNVILNLTVPSSYTVSLLRVQPTGILPVPKPITISGSVKFLNESEQRVVPVDIR